MTKNTLLELHHIIQGAARASSTEEQVQLVVDAISDLIGSDVCSLYQKNANNDMQLIASHGLVKVHPVIIPKDKGLVGLVAQTLNTVNIIDPEEHTNYYYVTDSNEERMHNFCGVPLVFHGEVIGVLVVQSFQAEVLAAEQEALLSTLATHLALLVASLPIEINNAPDANHSHEGFYSKKGISGAPGIAIGKAYLRQSAGLGSVMESHCQNIEEELTQWSELKIIVRSELEGERQVLEATFGENLAAVIDAYQTILEDPSFSGYMNDIIQTEKSFPWALKQTVGYFSDLFKEMEDPYLRARHEDIEHLGEKIYRAWCGSTPVVNDRRSATILVGHQLSVSDIVSLPTEDLVGIVCTAGAALSHISIFANALGIPAVMGVGELALNDGEDLIVDGDSGTVIISPIQAVANEYKGIIESRKDFKRRILADHDLPTVTIDGVRVKLLANSGLQADLQPGLRNGAEGIGLYRTEIPFMIRQSLPSEADQVEVYREVIDTYQDKPVYIRALDIGSDKPLLYLPHVNEENPALGWRGIRFTLDNIQLLLAQFRAIVSAAAGRENVHLLLPMVGSTGELDQCIALLDDALAQLSSEGKTVCRPKLGVMIEVPSSIALLSFWRNKLDFISIGSNDLSQYLLALDRNSPIVGKLYDPLHPAVIHDLQRIVQIATSCQLPVSLCGEMASDPIAVLLLVGMGIRQLSMSTSKLPIIKWLLRASSCSDAEAFLAEALTIDNAQEIRTLGERLLAKAGIKESEYGYK